MNRATWAMPLGATVAALFLSACGTEDVRLDDGPVANLVIDGGEPGSWEWESNWAAWADDPDGLSDVWEHAGLNGSPPSLDGRAILLAGTGQSSSCPLQFVGLRQQDGRVTVVLSETQDGKPVHDDTVCTADWQRVLFAVRVDPSEIRPPFRLAVGGQGQVHVEQPHHVSGLR